jgi:hypothetical protein
MRICQAFSKSDVTFTHTVSLYYSKIFNKVFSKICKEEGSAENIYLNIHVWAGLEAVLWIRNDFF